MDGGFSYHEGDAADSRMSAVAAARGVRLTSRSRPLTPADLSDFDLIVGMDENNLAAIQRAAEHWKAKHDIPPDHASKVKLMTDYLRDPKYAGKFREVPDPYYSGTSGFELVLDLLEDACDGLVEELRAERG